MRRYCPALIAVVIVCGLAASVFADRPVLPRVTINNSAISFQASLYPDYYRINSVTADMRWVARNDSLIQGFWNAQGDSVLSALASLGGANWVEPSLTIYLLRFYPMAGESDPLIVPLGGELNGVAIEAPPDRSGMLFNLIYQLSQRLLSQMTMPGSTVTSQAARHPLLQAGPYRRDNIAMSLTLAVAPLFIGPEPTLKVYNSPFWESRTLGREVFEEQIQKKWVITPQKTLAQWLAEEPYDSPLVDITRAPRATGDDYADSSLASMSGLPQSGRLGFTLKSVSGRFQIDKIDPKRLAYQGGLRIGDAISQVDTRRVSSVKELFERILTGLERGGSTLTVFRDGKATTVIIRRN
jgi:hypothetical protein